MKNLLKRFPNTNGIFGRLNHSYKTCITDLDDLKHCIRTECDELDHAVIAAAVRQWRHLSACVRAGGGHVEHELCF